MVMYTDDFSRPDDEDDLLTVLVGEDKHEFVFNRGTICKKSEFFRAACAGNWKESAEKIVHLPEAHKEIFGAYSDFLRTGKVSLNIKGVSDVEKETNQHKKQMYDRFIVAYALGDMLLDASFRNVVMDELKSWMDTYRTNVFHANLKTAYDMVLPSSKLMQFFIDQWVDANYEKDSFRTYSEGLPHEFVLELACVWSEERTVDRRKRLAERKTRREGTCTYHDHQSAVEETQCKSGL